MVVVGIDPRATYSGIAIVSKTGEHRRDTEVRVSTVR